MIINIYLHLPSRAVRLLSHRPFVYMLSYARVEVRITATVKFGASVLFAPNADEENKQDFFLSIILFHIS